MRRPLIPAVIAAAISFPVIAQQAVLYEGRDFRGRSITITQTAPNLGYHGFEDRASSLFVLSGTWEICSEPYFRGQCRIYGPGEYPTLGGQSNRISSARAVGSGGHAGPAAVGREWVDSGAPEVSVFDRRDFQGPLRTLREVTPNFEPLGFNDAIASIVVRRGTWEFCTDAFFRGECRTYGPGQYPSLPRGHDDRYSSARPVEGGWQGAGPPREQWSQGPARIRLFEYGQFAGRSIWLGANTPDFDRIGFNDRAESVIVEGGNWTLCSDANQGGECRVFRPGQYPVLPPELRSRVSSAYLR
jgi:hypothetical protein